MPESCPATSGAALRHGFRLAPPVPIAELCAVAIEGVHARTGLRVLCLEADDPENLLAVCVPTVPADDRGLPHIAEHVVLGGSAAHPLRDPFVELLKCSMATFANAMTYADRTVYPVASNVPADFRNLARVYLDAVFHPLLRRESFHQEGYFLAPLRGRGAGGALHEQGVVHSEMRGAYAEVETFVQTAVLSRLLPDTPYRHDAGGIPAAIAGLRYEEFLAFCQAHYRADRALVLLYGDLGVGEWLPLLDEALAGLPAGVPAPPPVIRAPAPWRTPQEEQVPVPLDPSETVEDCAAAVLAWRTGNAVDVGGHLEMDLLDHLLLGHAGAPLQQALTQSGLGHDVFLSGYDSERREAVFQVGLRGCAPTDRHRFQDLVLETLRRVAAEGLPAATIHAALNQMEFSRRLVDGQFPVLLAEEVFGHWMYGGSPVEALALEEPLLRLRAQAMGDPQFVPELIRAKLLENPHRLLLAVYPDAALGVAEQRRERERLAAMGRALSAAERRELRRQAEGLRVWQETPDAPEDLARLPRLRREHLPLHPPPPVAQAEDLGGTVLLSNRVAAGGLEDCVHAVELSGLPARLQDLLPLFAYCLGRMDTERSDYASLAGRIALLGGGVRGSCCTRRLWLGGPTVPVLAVRSAALHGEFGEALELAREVLLTTRFEPGERLGELLRQRRSRLLANVLGAGHLVAACEAAAGFSGALDLRNRWHGPPQLRLADSAAEGLPGTLAGVAAGLEEIRRRVLAAGLGVLVHTGSAAGTDAAREHVAGFAPASCSGPAPVGSPSEDGTPQATRSALVAAANGAHVAWCVPAPVFTDPAAPLLELGAHLLSLGAAWEEIRAKGGAYGASCEYDSILGTFAFLSYRDPTPDRTLRTFEGLARRMAKLSWTAAEIEEALPAVVRTDQRCLRPPQLTEAALHDYLQHVSYEERDLYRQRLLRAGPAEVADALAGILRHGRSRAAVCVLGDFDLLARIGSAGVSAPAPLLGGQPRQAAADRPI